jgi:hypothetical protein
MAPKLLRSQRIRAYAIGSTPVDKRDIARGVMLKSIRRPQDNQI